MATENKAVTCYLPSELEESLTRYCTEYEITRKDKSGKIKPSLGTGIVEILKVFFSGETVPSPLPSGLSTLPSSVVTEEKLQQELQQAIASLRSEFQPALNTQKEVEALLGK